MSEELKSGVSTSEFKLVVVAQVIGLVLETVATLIAQLHEQFPEAAWLSVAMVIGGVLMQLASLLKYITTRTNLKVAKVVETEISSREAAIKVLGENTK